jgi:methyl-accepting chemotaxis protein
VNERTFVTLRSKALLALSVLTLTCIAGAALFARTARGDDGRASLQWPLILVVLVTVSLAGGLFWAFQQHILVPLDVLSSELHALETGHTEPRAEFRRLTGEGRGELGGAARGLEAMLAGMALRDADRQREQDEREQQLREDFGRQRRAAEEIRTRAQAVIDETVRAVLTDLEEVISQVEEVRVAAGTIDDGVGEANQVTQRVVSRAGEADVVVTTLGTSLHKVDDMARLIAQVAAQTNLLALNATIEAVRAGSAGAGFAVVATEVKGLAKTTSDSTIDITETITMLERDAKAVGEALAGMSSGVADIDAATARLSAIALEQHAIVDVLAQRIVEAKARISDIASVTSKLERRASDRIPVALDAELRIADRRERIVVTSLSDTGVSCKTSGGVRLSVPTELVLSIRLGSRDVVVSATAVRHIDGDASHLGMAFANADQVALATIRQYLDDRPSRDAA